MTCSKIDNVPLYLFVNREVLKQKHLLDISHAGMLTAET
jgi:hypothetical protein